MKTDHYLLQPGYIFVPDQPVSISTVIGTGVCICIYDNKKQMGGMNHFQFPYMAKKGKTTAVYGNVATIALIKIMLARDSEKHHLEAQIFGGACNPKKTGSGIGRENIEIARNTLLKYKIPILSEDVGGEKGRKVVFNTSTNDVAVLKVESLRHVDWYPYQSTWDVF
ncbi:MAG: chemotaxis protein CheD [Proteobacteria bacterium]|nr:chemotaxis protein CheD [Pseudomonadota bacterium]MBU1583388.1 chemotaxis protein CheD [Pseudomonadota bacterium]MBU2453661.1 chemotaxis protein CheD [Pseudomonadota bacterium]MBU2629245.1 chemotaxis protein CheD [Pseudomonadota bacterium]